MQLARYPLCADPRQRHPKQIVAATEVHHLVARRRGGSDHASNLQSLCKSCHSFETTIEQREGEGKSLVHVSP